MEIQIIENSKNPKLPRVKAIVHQRERNQVIEFLKIATYKKTIDENVRKFKYHKVFFIFETPDGVFLSEKEIKKYYFSELTKRGDKWKNHDVILFIRDI